MNQFYINDDWLASELRIAITPTSRYDLIAEEALFVPWNKGKKGWQKDSPETKEKKRLAHLGKKRGPNKKRWTDSDSTKERKSKAAKASWTPERRAALAERNRMRWAKKNELQ